MNNFQKFHNIVDNVSKPSFVNHSPYNNSPNFDYLPSFYCYTYYLGYHVFNPIYKSENMYEIMNFLIAAELNAFRVLHSGAFHVLTKSANDSLLHSKGGIFFAVQVKIKKQ